MGHRTEVGRRGEVATTGSAGTSVRWPATFLAYSMPPIDSATKESRLHVRCKSSSQLIIKVIISKSKVSKYLRLQMKLQVCRFSHRRSSTRSMSHREWHRWDWITHLDRETSNEVVHLGHLGRLLRLVLLSHPPLFSQCRLICLLLRLHLGQQYFITMLQCKANICTN